MLLSMNDYNNNNFQKEERVSGDKRVEALFTKGKSFLAYPLKVVYLETNSPLSSTYSLLISVPKKRIKSAVKRNRVKRLIREAYRLNKHTLNAFAENNRCFDFGFVYIKDEVTDYATIEKGVIKAIKILKKKLFIINEE